MLVGLVIADLLDGSIGWVFLDGISYATSHNLTQLILSLVPYFKAMAVTDASFPMTHVAHSSTPRAKFAFKRSLQVGKSLLRV